MKTIFENLLDSAELEKFTDPRQQAKISGEIKYIPKLPCSKGHFLRFTSNGRCVECRNKREREYRIENHDRLLAYEAIYREENRDRTRFNQTKWRTTHKNEHHKKNSEWSVANLWSGRKRTKRYRALHPDQYKAQKATRRAREIKAEGTYTAAEIKNLFRLQGGKCAYFRICKTKIKYTSSGFHADHIIALINGGTNWISNIQLTCANCNLRKSAKDALTYAQSVGLLI